MKFYNSEIAKMNSQKQSQEQLQKKLKADQKELETSRKK